MIGRILTLLGAVGILALLFIGGLFTSLAPLPAVLDQVPVTTPAPIVAQTPGPLRAPVRSPRGTLSVSGILAATNQERQVAGFPALKINAKLSSAAQAKVADMFTKQYFDHVSPSGTTPAQLVERAGYEYVTTGENLALGNFASDTALVDAWMKSPGHRANILGASFTEIGIAVKQGAFEGHTTWLAVQEFAKPLSACPTVAPSLQQTFDEKRRQAEELEKELQNKPDSRDREAVEAYNLKVDEYNALVAELKTLVEQLNAQIKAFNACVKV